jgi:hypothetical protein
MFDYIYLLYATFDFVFPSRYASNIQRYIYLTSPRCYYDILKSLYFFFRRRHRRRYLRPLRDELVDHLLDKFVLVGIALVLRLELLHLSVDLRQQRPRPISLVKDQRQLEGRRLETPLDRVASPPMVETPVV